MIPTIVEIVKGLKDGFFTADQANTWLVMHVEMAAEYGTPDSELRDAFAMNAPIDFEVACGAFGVAAHEYPLAPDTNRIPFLAVWAMIRYEYADAMLEARKKHDAATPN